MVKSVLGVNHQGLRDWMIQRLSALFMAVYFLGFFYFFASHPVIHYEEWHRLFANIGIKIATILFIVSLLFHAWVGVWTVLTDYIKSYILRSILILLVFLMLVACFFWGLLILWSV